MHVSDLQGINLSKDLGIAQLIGLAPTVMNKPVQESAVYIIFICFVILIILSLKYNN